MLITQTSAQQWWQEADTLRKPRIIIASTSQLVTYAGSLAGLYSLWYAQYDQGSFHFFDDTHTWMQMDKVGHVTTAYQIGDGLYRINRWTGAGHRASMRWALLTGYSYQLAVEVFDGFSEAWGFSYSDQLANTLGTASFFFQQVFWEEQRLRWKYSFQPSGLTDGSGPEAQRARDLYGTALSEQWLKDYNGQTHWISANVWSLAGKPQRFPRWLNIALGYSVDGMLGAEVNAWQLESNDPRSVTYTSSVRRERQLLLSLDIDLYHARLPRALEFVKPLFGVIKFPFPAVEWNSERGLRGHWFYF